MADAPHPEDDKRTLRASARANYGSVATLVVLFGVSQVVGYEPIQAAAAVAAVGAVAIPAIDRAVSKQARVRTIEQAERSLFLLEKGRDLGRLMIRPTSDSENVQTSLGHGDEGRPQRTRDRGR